MLKLDKDYITIIAIPVIICVLAILNAETPKEKQGLERCEKCRVSE